MFNGASSFNQSLYYWNDILFIELENGDISYNSVTKDIVAMLDNTTSLQYPILSGSVNQNNIYYAVNQLKNNATNYSYYFRPIPQWDTRLVTDISGLFEDFTNFNEGISGWNVSNVVNMNSLFQNANSFNQYIGTWDTSNVKDMAFMFNGATIFNQVIRSWDISNVTTMESMFQDTNDFNQDISGWDVSEVVNMDSMFQNATAFNQIIGKWTTTQVTSMDSMFDGALIFNQSLYNWSDIEFVSKTDISSAHKSVINSVKQYTTITISNINGFSESRQYLLCGGTFSNKHYGLQYFL